MADGLKVGVRYQVFSIKELRDEGETKRLWVKAGSAWLNRDNSINVYLDVLPLDGKLHIREAAPEQPLLVPAKPQPPDDRPVGTKATV